MHKTTFSALAIAAVSMLAAAVVNATDYPRAEGLTVSAVRPAQNEGKTITMEQAVMGTGIRAGRFPVSWYGNTSFLYLKDSKTQLCDALTGKDIDEDPVIGKFASADGEYLFKALPEDASNITPNAAAEGHDSAMEGNRAIGNAPALAFTQGQSLYYIDMRKHIRPIAISENSDITYGHTASRNEFGINSGIFWAPDGRSLAFYRKDESKVTDFPLLDITTRTGSLVNLKYPMTGMDSENVRVGVYNLSENSTVYLQADDFGYDHYLTNVSWSPDCRHIFVQVLDRTQRHMRLNMYRASDGKFEKTILTEDNEKWVEPSDQLEWFGFTGKFIYRTDNRDGYKNLYLCDTLGNIDRITKVAADVKFVAENGEKIFYTSAEVSPVENHLFYVNVSVNRKGAVKIGAPVRLTKDEGWHNVQVNADGTWFLDSYSSFNVPNVVKIASVDGKTSRTLFTAEDPLKEYAHGEMTLGTVKSADGKYDNWYRLFLPANFDPSKKYPVVLYVYGGPHSQMVKDSWLGQIRLWELYMAQHGYIVYVQDNRGTENRGAEYEKAIKNYCGQAEMADQVAGISELMTLPYVDKNRIGVHGWSYGGFMTISLMTTYPEIFKVGVAGGPVIDWKWYEIMYGERYMDTMESNPEGYAATSLINKAKDLKGKLLICQGVIDNTVLWQHSLNFVRECIKNQIQVDYFPYPCAEHNVFGRDRIHLMDKVTLYFEDYLK